LLVEPVVAPSVVPSGLPSPTDADRPVTTGVPDTPVIGGIGERTVAGPDAVTPPRSSADRSPSKDTRSVEILLDDDLDTGGGAPARPAGLLAPPAVATVLAAAGEPRPPGDSAVPDEVTIHIDHIDVIADTPPSGPVPPRRPVQPRRVLSLEQYLAQQGR
jgi:hypothetical protein